MSFSSYSERETNSEIHRKSLNTSISNDDNEDFIDDNDDSTDRSTESTNNSINKIKNKKTLGRVKIKMAYIDNKLRRYTTFSKRKTGIMKKAYELATLTGTEVMLLVASETGHVYTYATAKLQPMITSEAGKALIQTCLEKDESIVECPSTTTTLNNHDVIFAEENQRKKQINVIKDRNISIEIRPIKRAKLKPAEKIKQVIASTSRTPILSSIYPTPTTVALPLSCLINPNSEQHSITGSTSFTIDLNSLKTTGMNVVYTPSPNSSQSSPPSNVPLVLTLGNFLS